MSRASSAAARKRRRQRSAIRLTAYQPEYQELARAWLTSDQEEAGSEGWDEWIHGDWQYRWVVMRGDVPVGLGQATILPPEAVPKGSQTAAPACEIGYLTGPDYRGQHIATDAVALLPRQPALQPPRAGPKAGCSWTRPAPPSWPRSSTGASRSGSASPPSPPGSTPTPPPTRRPPPAAGPGPPWPRSWPTPSTPATSSSAAPARPPASTRPGPCPLSAVDLVPKQSTPRSWTGRRGTRPSRSAPSVGNVRDPEMPTTRQGRRYILRSRVRCRICQRRM
jgi:hypothetical protein